MELSIKSLEQIASPIEVVNLLGRPLNKGPNGYYTTNCPKCESKLYIIDKEFVCENNSCTFRAGSVADYLVASKMCKWDNVVDTLNTILENKLTDTVIFKNKASIGHRLKNRRRIYDFFLRMSLEGSVNNIDSIQYKNAIRAQGIDPDLLKWSVYVLSQDNCRLLQEMVRDLDAESKLTLSGTNIILPYFTDYHTISHIVVLRTPVAKPERFNISPNRISYFGLLQRHPRCESTKLAYTYADAAKLNTQYGRVSPENICLHMMLDAKAEGVSFTLPKAEYVITDDNNDDLRAVSILKRYIPDLHVDNHRVNIYRDNKSITSDSFIINCVMVDIRRGHNIKDILDMVDLLPQNKQDLLSRLHAESLFEEADTVRTYFKTLPIYTDDKLTLYTSPHGYTLKRNTGDNYSSYVTNFTVELEQNVVFTESTDIFHAGHVAFNGGQYPVIIKQDELERAGDLEKAVRRATLGFNGDGTDAMPTIKERSAAKPLVSYLRSCIAVLPRCEGIPMLGWSHKRTSFYAPYFITDRKGTRVGKKYFHPTIQALTNFTTDISDASHLHLNLPEEIVHVLNQAASFIVRTYLSMPVRPIALYNRAEARSLLSSIFSSIGQIAVSQLNSNIRGEEMQGVRGFPYYAVGYSYAQITKSTLPAFILCDAGVNIENIFSEEILEKGRQAMKYIVQKVAEWTLSSTASNFKSVNSVSRNNAYSVEGASIITDACGLLSWPSSKTPFENLDKLLSGIRFDEVKQFFIRDINRHIVQIKKQALEQVSVDLPGLEQELGVISKQVRITDGTIDVDSESMLEALNTFYHTPPTITEVFDPQSLLTKAVMP